MALIIIDTVDEGFHEFTCAIRPRLQETAHRGDTKARVRNIEITQVGELNAAARSGYSRDIGGIDQAAVHLAAEYRRDPARRIAHLQDRHILLRVKFPIAQYQLSDDVGHRAKTADGEPLAFEIFRFANLLARHDGAVQPVDRDADHFEIHAGEGRLNLRRQVGGSELNAAADNRLIHQRAAADIDALRGQSIFFEDPVLVHELQKIMGDTDAAVADLDWLQTFRLCSNQSRHQI